MVLFRPKKVHLRTTVFPFIIMARAHRHYIPGCVRHITHRCQRQEFLLNLDKDRTSWHHWLYEAKKRYGLCVLNYIATSNHIHLLVVVRPDYKGTMVMREDVIFRIG